MFTNEFREKLLRQETLLIFWQESRLASVCNWLLYVFGARRYLTLHPQQLTHGHPYFIFKFHFTSLQVCLQINRARLIK